MKILTHKIDQPNREELKSKLKNNTSWSLSNLFELWILEIYVIYLYT